MKGLRLVVLCAGVLFLSSVNSLRAQSGVVLTEAEEDKLRDEQEPGRRIEVYLDLTQARLEKFEAFRQKPASPQYDYGGYLDELLADYIGLNEELKNWIEYHYQRNNDMRGGLRALLERGPQHLALLRRAQQSPDEYAADYENSLEDAVDQVTDMLDGATLALANQEKKLGELKQEAKEAERLAKQRAKEEARRTEEEKKLRKREGRSRIPAQED